MNEHATCNSRQYRFGYRLQSASDFPLDFSIPPLTDGWLSAIFVPGDTEALWKPPEYPPRIYILTRDMLMVYSHPASFDAPFVVPLRDLSEIGTERALLHGVVEFHVHGSSHGFRYNTLHRNYLNEFLRTLRSVWLPRNGNELPAMTLSHATQGMTFRCWYALRSELDPGEALFGICCRPPITLEKKKWFHRKARTLPAVLLAATNHRLITISTGNGESDDLYGLVIRSAATRNLKAATIGPSAHGLVFSVTLKHGHDWRFHFEDAQSAPAARFLDLLEYLQPAGQE